jgi:hypothetical protein
VSSSHLPCTAAVWAAGAHQRGAVGGLTALTWLSLCGCSKATDVGLRELTAGWSGEDASLTGTGVERAGFASSLVLLLLLLL